MSGTNYVMEGNEHLNDLDNKSGSEVDTRKWKGDSYEDSYNGNIELENLHGYGVYSSGNQKCNFMYEGYFYANNYNGYARVTFEDCSYFEGLFKNNSRFGPGVLSHSSGLQDVGMWNGPTIARLASVVLPELIPSLAYSNLGKVNLLKYRKVVSLKGDNVNTVQDVLSLLQSENYISCEDLCNNNVRNPKSLFFHKEYYDQHYFGSISDFSIDVSLSEEDIKENASEENVNDNYLSPFLKKLCNIDKFSVSELELVSLQFALLKKLHKNLCSKKPKTKKVDVTELLAWNNEPLSIEFLKHTFTCRNQESNISFVMKDILVGNRQKFGDPGEIECACLSFLTNSCYGENANIYQLYINFNLDVNLCDAKGNTAVMFAAAHDRVSTISLLVNLGANLDAINDEGLTPLTLCLLRYISLVQNIEDWESAFIDSLNTKTYSAHSWCPRRSLVNMSTYSIFDTVQHCESLFFKSINKLMLYERSTGEYEKEDMAELYKVLGILKPPKREQNFQGIYNARHKTADKYVFNTKVPFHPNKFTENEDTLKHSEVVYNTVILLLHYGAKGTIGNVPLPPLVLSLYINKSVILKEILKTVDVNSIKLEDDLTPLHYIVNMELHPTLIEKCVLLLQHGADPNSKTLPTFHIQEVEDVLSKNVEMELTPLQLLSLRIDFPEDLQGVLNDIAKTLIEGGAKVDESFVSYTPLTMAIVRGNYVLVNTLLNAGADPNMFLGELGAPLTLYIVEPFLNKLPPLNACISIIDYLVEYLGNPLLPIGNFGNVLEFIKERRSEKKLPSRKTKIKETKNTKNSMKVSLSHSIKEYIHRKFFDVATRHYQSKVLLSIALFILSGETDSMFNEMNTRFLTVVEAIQVLQTFVNYNILQLENEFHSVLIFKILEFIKNFHQQYSSAKEINIAEFVANMTSGNAKTFYSKQNYKPFELDINEDTYMFCFHCGLKSNKTLVLCPSCKLIYFCSSECEISNHKATTRHPCSELFYTKALPNESQTLKHLLDAFKKMLDKFAINYKKRSDFISNFFSDYPELKTPLNERINATNNRKTLKDKETNTSVPLQEEQIITSTDKSTHFILIDEIGMEKEENTELKFDNIDSFRVHGRIVKDEDLNQSYKGNSEEIDYKKNKPQKKPVVSKGEEKEEIDYKKKKPVVSKDEAEEEIDYHKNKAQKKAVVSKVEEEQEIDYKKNKAQKKAVVSKLEEEEEIDYKKNKPLKKAAVSKDEEKKEVDLKKNKPQKKPVVSKDEEKEEIDYKNNKLQKKAAVSKDDEQEEIDYKKKKPQKKPVVLNDEEKEGIDYKKNKPRKKPVVSEATDSTKFSASINKNQDILQSNQTRQQIKKTKKAPAMERSISEVTDDIPQKTDKSPARKRPKAVLNTIDTSNVTESRENKQDMFEKSKTLQDSKRAKRTKAILRSEDRESMRPSSNNKKEKNKTTPLKKEHLLGQNKLTEGSKKPINGAVPLSQKPNPQSDLLAKGLHDVKINFTDKILPMTNQTGVKSNENNEAYKMKDLLPAKFQNLSLQVQLFALKLLELYPDFDMSDFFKPFVCFSNGELYYKFKDESRVCENYTNI